MKGRLTIALALGVAIAIVVLVWKLRTEDESSTTVARPEASTKSSQVHRPSLGPGRPDPETPAPPVPTPAFERVKRESLARFTANVTTRVQQCTMMPSAGSAAPPRPRDVRLVLEWMPELSTTELQTLVVKEVAIIDVGGLSDASRDCIRQATGMQLTYPVPADQLPMDARTFDQIVKLPVP